MKLKLTTEKSEKKICERGKSLLEGGSTMARFTRSADEHLGIRITRGMAETSDAGAVEVLEATDKMDVVSDRTFPE